MPTITNMSKAQLRIFIEKVLQQDEAVFTSNMELSSGVLGPMLVSDGITITIAENETVTLMPSEFMMTRRTTI